MQMAMITVRISIMAMEVVVSIMRVRTSMATKHSTKQCFRVMRYPTYSVL